MFGIGQSYQGVIAVFQAEKAWNAGNPFLSLATAKHASQHYAHHWARRARELRMAEPQYYSPFNPQLASVVHKPFWLAVMQAHGARKVPQRYWHSLLSKASIEGNLSVMEAFSEVFGLPLALSKIEELTFAHPRVVGWQASNGLVSKKHVRNIIDLNKNAPEYSGWDAQEFVQGGPAMQAWIAYWVKLPAALINEEDGYAVAHYLCGLLDAMEAQPGERSASGMTNLKIGHQFRKHRAWAQVSDLSTPHMAGTTLAMLQTLYERFGFEPVLMDTVLGRWTWADLDDPKVCAIVHYINNTPTQTGLSWQGGSNLSPEEVLAWRKIIEKKADPLVAQMLQLQADGNQSFSVYTSAIPFFRPAADKMEMAEQFEIGPLLAD